MRWLLAMVLLLVPLGAWGADGDGCDSTQWDGPFGSSLLRAVQCVVLCDDLSTDTTCGDGFFEMNRNMFDIIVFRSWGDDGGCDAAAFGITTVTSEGDAAPKPVGTGVAAGSLSAVDGSNMMITPSHPRTEEDVIYSKLVINSSGTAGCVGTVDLMMIGYEVGR